MIQCSLIPLNHDPYYSFDICEEILSVYEDGIRLQGFPIGTYLTHLSPETGHLAISFVEQLPQFARTTTLFFQETPYGLQPFPNPYIPQYRLFNSLEDVAGDYPYLLSQSYAQVLERELKSPLHFKAGVLTYQADMLLKKAPSNSYFVTFDTLLDRYLVYWKNPKRGLQLAEIFIHARVLRILGREYSRFSDFVRVLRLNPIQEQKQLVGSCEIE